MYWNFALSSQFFCKLKNCSKNKVHYNGKKTMPLYPFGLFSPTVTWEESAIFYVFSSFIFTTVWYSSVWMWHILSDFSLMDIWVASRFLLLWAVLLWLFLYSPVTDVQELSFVYSSLYLKVKLLSHRVCEYSILEDNVKNVKHFFQSGYMDLYSH